MRLTNNFSLPEVLMDLCAEDDYDKGEADFSTTELIQPAWRKMLFAQHGDDVTEDISERFWSMSGNAKHYILEKIAKQNPERYIAEVRYYIEIDGWKIGGKLDLFDKEKGQLWDYKETSCWKIAFGDYEDWSLQASINRYILSQNGIHPKWVSNMAMLKDWKKRESRYKKDYPVAPIVPVNLKVMSDEDTLAYIKERLALHVAAREGKAEVCSSKERWEQPAKWAVYKGANKRATKLADSEEEARQVAATIPQSKVVYRPGESTRCIYYCPVNSFCKFYRENVAPNLKEE
jgi:hypothetical protein